MNVGSENSRAVYLRGAVLNEYSNGRWSPSPMMRSPLKTRTTLIPPNTSLESNTQTDTTRWEHQYTISIRSLDNGPAYLFAPWKTVEFRVGDEPIRLGLDFERGIFIKDGIGGKVQYAVRTLNTQFDPIDYEQLTARSPIIETAIEPEIIQLAQSILSEAGIEPDPEIRPMKDDASALRVIEQHLRSQYEYTLDAQPVPQGIDATKWFLFDRKAGHCEYYASALALMARAVGIPARVLTGYIASDFNSVTGQYVVRESNAHAWIEAQIAPGRWRIFDGTPPVDFHALHEPDPSFWRSITKFYESVEFLWVRSVVGFDSTTRQNLIGSTSTDLGLSVLGESLLNRFAAGRQRLIYHGAIVGIVVFCASLFLGIVLLKYKQACAMIWEQLHDRLMRWYAKIFCPKSTMTDPHHDRLESMIHLALHRLGIPKPAWRPLKAHIQDTLTNHGSITEPARRAIVEASDLLYRAKFSQARDPIDSSRLRDLESALRKSEKSASQPANR